MKSDSERWEPARLIPVRGISGANEQEGRGTSALLAVMKSVNEFGRSLISNWGAPAGTLDTFTEVEFELGRQKVRPDGLIRVTRGKRVWIALVEVKTQRNKLDASQIVNYLDVAREKGFDAVVTISNQIPIAPGAHPVSIDKRKLSKVGLFHISWAQIRTEALIEHMNKSVKDPDQAWILSEFIRFLDWPKSGMLDFEGMGTSWVRVREDVSTQTLRARDPAASDVAYHFDQLVEHVAMRLSQKTGVWAKQALTRRDAADPIARTSLQAERLAKSGDLLGRIAVPGAISDIEILADLRGGRVEASVDVPAPTDRSAKSRVLWLTRQLRDVPFDVFVRADLAWSRQLGVSKLLSDVLEDPKALLESNSDDIRSFRISLGRKAGTKNGTGLGTFADSVGGVVSDFYESVIQNLIHWVPPAPQVKVGSGANEILESVSGNAERSYVGESESPVASASMTSNETGWEPPGG